jgi:hypothetical protein
MTVNPRSKENICSATARLVNGHSNIRKHSSFGICHSIG